jgi:hypothetical protein
MSGKRRRIRGAAEGVPEGKSPKGMLFAERRNATGRVAPGHMPESKAISLSVLCRRY